MTREGPSNLGKEAKLFLTSPVPILLPPVVRWRFLGWAVLQLWAFCSHQQSLQDPQHAKPTRHGLGGWQSFSPAGTALQWRPWLRGGFVFTLITVCSCGKQVPLGDGVRRPSSPTWGMAQFSSTTVTWWPCTQLQAIPSVPGCEVETDMLTVPSVQPYPGPWDSSLPQTLDSISVLDTGIPRQP